MNDYAQQHKKFSALLGDAQGRAKLHVCVDRGIERGHKRRIQIERESHQNCTEIQRDLQEELPMVDWPKLRDRKNEGEHRGDQDIP